MNLPERCNLSGFFSSNSFEANEPKLGRDGNRHKHRETFFIESRIYYRRARRDREARLYVTPSEKRDPGRLAESPTRATRRTSRIAGRGRPCAPRSAPAGLLRSGWPVACVLCLRVRGGWQS